MATKIDELLPEVTMRAPCPPHVMADILVYAGYNPHSDYVEFIERHNGCDGPVGNESYVRIWAVDEVLTGNEALRVSEVAPGLLVFGGDGGNEAYAFDRKDPSWPIVVVPLVGLSRASIRTVARTFTEFVHQLIADKLPFPSSGNSSAASPTG